MNQSLFPDCAAQLSRLIPRLMSLAKSASSNKPCGCVSSLSLTALYPSSTVMCARIDERSTYIASCFICWGSRKSTTTTCASVKDLTCQTNRTRVRLQLRYHYCFDPIERMATSTLNQGHRTMEPWTHVSRHHPTHDHTDGWVKVSLHTVPNVLLANTCVDRIHRRRSFGVREQGPQCSHLQTKHYGKRTLGNASCTRHTKASPQVTNSFIRHEQISKPPPALCSVAKSGHQEYDPEALCRSLHLRTHRRDAIGGDRVRNGENRCARVGRITHVV